MGCFISVCVDFAMLIRIQIGNSQISFFEKNSPKLIDSSEKINHLLIFQSENYFENDRFT